MQVTALNIYPVKSFQGVRLQSASIDDFGFKGDRRWMLVDAQGKFLTQRQLPSLSLVRLNYENNQIQLTLPNGAQTILDPARANQECSVKVWRDTVPAQRLDDDANGLISDYIGQDCFFVFMPETVFRQVDTRYYAANQAVSFADGFPILLLSEASLTDLNQRLAQPVTMDRFRGNIVIDADEPYCEDKWRQVKIGQVLFSVVKPCSRCVMTTVDATTGTKGVEPLRTLSTYRKNEFGVCFGQNLVQDRLGEINVGDLVEVID